jgi:hypothetical protein
MKRNPDDNFRQRKVIKVMTKNCNEDIIYGLQDKGFIVVVKDPYGSTFNEKYRVFQNVNWVDLKVVAVDDNGNVIGLQG